MNYTDRAELEQALTLTYQYMAHWREQEAREMKIVTDLQARGEDVTSACSRVECFQAALELLQGDREEFKKALIALDKAPTELALLAGSDELAWGRSPANSA